MPAKPVLLCGDPHGDYRPILRAYRGYPEPGTIILVGDQDCERPLGELLATVISAGWDVRWIIGNHDVDKPHYYDNLVGHPGDIGGQVVQLPGGLRGAGLSGVFKGKVWFPKDGSEQAAFRTRAEYLRTLRPGDRWRGGLPLGQRATVFPDDIERLGRQRCDVLVTHEAPTSHRHGFGAIDQLAAAMSSRLVVHGHHHRSYEGQLDGGIAVRGLSIGEVWELDSV